MRDELSRRHFMHCATCATAASGLSVLSTPVMAAAAGKPGELKGKEAVHEFPYGKVKLTGGRISASSTISIRISSRWITTASSRSSARMPASPPLAPTWAAGMTATASSPA